MPLPRSINHLLDKLIWVLLLIGLTFSCDPRNKEANYQLIQSVNQANVHTPDIQYLISRNGDTIPTGVAIPSKGKWINPESVSAPKVVNAGDPKIFTTQNNIHPAGDPDTFRTFQTSKKIPTDKDSVPILNTLTVKIKVAPAFHSPVQPGQSPRFKDAAIDGLQYLDIDQGMNGSSVNSIIEDSQGYLWFATSGGITRYDGNNFTHFTTKEGLTSNNITSILEDHKGNLWIIPDNGGLICYDGSDFTHYTIGSGRINLVISILEDSQKNLWIGTRDGLVRFDGQSFFLYSTKEGLSVNSVHSILEDSQGFLWLGTSLGLNRFDGKSFTFYKGMQKLGYYYVNSIIEDHKGDLWFGSSRGLSRFDGNSIIHYTTNEGLSDNSVLSVKEDRQGNLWIGTWSSGVNRFDGKNFTHYTTKEGLSNNKVFSILEDNQGVFWFGTGAGGVNRFDTNGFNFYQKRNGLSNDNIQSLLEDSKGNIWIGTAGGGLNCYNGNQFFHYTTKEGISSNSVYSIIEDNKKNLWFGTWRGGVNRFDGHNFIHYTVREGLSRNWVKDILEDRHGHLWFGTSGGGISQYNGHSFTQYTQNDGLIDNFVHSILEDRQGNLWIGTQRGLSRFDGNYFIHYTTNEGLSHNSIICMEEDRKGNLWFGTSGGGINRFDGNNFIHYTTKDGLSHNVVLSIQEDSLKNIWLSTQKGITLLVPQQDELSLTSNSKTKDYRVITYGKADGLKRLNFEANSVYLNQKNQIWWGSQGGLTMLDLNQFSLPQTSPKVMLNAISVQNRFVDFRRLHDSSHTFSFGDILRQSFDSVVAFYNYPVDMTLPYDLNHLTFQFSGMDWAAPHKMKYSYILDGADKNWSDPKPTNIADYRNIPYGTFTFKVKAIGAAQSWSNVTEYTFTIRPPWWHTWWARTLYFVFGLAAIYSYIHWRTYALRKRQKELEQTVTERTAEVVAQKEVIQKEKERSEELLLNILPSETAEELKQFGAAQAKDYEMVTVLFTDFKGFTMHSERLSAKELVAEIDHCFKAFDQIMEKHNIEKIKTIGDAYMAAAGLPVPNTTNPADAVKAALAICDFMQQYHSKRKAAGQEAFEIRIGIHTGPVVAGIVGIKKFAYDIWGDTVNLAARMESSGEVGRVNISQSTYEHLKGNDEFTFISRGKVKAKNKGEIEMFFVENGK